MHEFTQKRRLRPVQSNCYHYKLDVEPCCVQERTLIFLMVFGAFLVPATLLFVILAAGLPILGLTFTFGLVLGLAALSLAVTALRLTGFGLSLAAVDFSAAYFLLATFASCFHGAFCASLMRFQTAAPGVGTDHKHTQLVTDDVAGSGYLTVYFLHTLRGRGAWRLRGAHDCRPNSDRGPFIKMISVSQREISSAYLLILHCALTTYFCHGKHDFSVNKFCCPLNTGGPGFSPVSLKSVMITTNMGNIFFFIFQAFL